MSPSSLLPGLKPHHRRTKAARRLITSRLDDARQAEAVLARALTPDAVHDLRVATRRLRATLRAFRDLGDLAPREREVKRLQDALGEVRDLHVQGAWLEEAARKLGAPKRPGLQGMHARLMGLLPDKEQRLQRALERWKGRTVPALEQEAERLEGPGRFAGGRVRQELRHRLRQVHGLMKDCLKQDLDGPTAHELRKSAKKLRYEAELLQPALGSPVNHLLQALKPLQKMLGDLHDADVRIHLLRELARRGAPAERASARALLRTVREERARHAADVHREIQDWRKEKRVRALRAHLR